MESHIEPAQAPIWNENETFLALDNTGFYEVTIVAADKAGNKSTAKKVTFGIVKQGPRLTITDKNDSSFYKNVELKVESDIVIHDATASIEKTINGETTTEVKSFERKGKTAVLSLTEDGDYKVSVTVKDRQNQDPGHQLGVTSFTIDHTHPKAVVALDGTVMAEDELVVDGEKTVKITVTDKHHDAYNVTVKKNGEEYGIDPFVRDGDTSYNRTFIERRWSL